MERETPWGRCVFCGQWVRNLVTESCAACNREIEAAIQEREANEAKAARYAPRFIVVDDPLPVEQGGFRAGSGFSTNDKDAMLRMGYFTAGMVLYDNKEEKHYRVMGPRGSQSKAQRLTEVANYAE